MNNNKEDYYEKKNKEKIKESAKNQYYSGENKEKPKTYEKKKNKRI